MRHRSQSDRVFFTTVDPGFSDGFAFMDKNVHPVAAFFVGLISVVTLAGWFWATGEAKEYGGPAGLTVDPDGHLYIQIRSHLLEHDADGRFVTRHDLAEFSQH